jgi:TRAP-type mannitol/chloroaromatic compound transport system permease large subunit
VVYKWMGGLRGGLAAATIVASTILAAMVGVIGAAVVTMGMIALPAMLKRKYDQQIALGSIMAGGTLGILIPPSILAILYAVVAQQSVGELYLGSVMPGLMLSGMYVGLRAGALLSEPSLCPSLPKERGRAGGAKLKLLPRLIAPLILVFLVLGSAFRRHRHAGGGRRHRLLRLGIVVALMHKRFDWCSRKRR